MLFRSGGVFLQKKRKKLKEMGELTQLTQEKKYSFVPEEEEEPKNNEKGQKPYEPPKEAAGSNTILLSDYLQKKKEAVWRIGTFPLLAVVSVYAN